MLKPIIIGFGNLHMALQEQQEHLEDVDEAMVQLLAHRYGDGLIYISNEAGWRLLRRAVRLGLVSSEGFVTPRGLSLLARHGDD